MLVRFQPVDIKKLGKNYCQVVCGRTIETVVLVRLVYA